MGKTESSSVSMRQDRNFDGKSTAFERDIYGSSKGFIRTQVLWEDMITQIPELAEGGLSVLDAGGGSGHLAVQMARVGNTVVLCDPSQEMLDIARQAARETEIMGELTFVQATIRELSDQLQRRFQLVVCHAVLEWLGEPRAAPQQLAGLMDPAGQLSLMFYNFNSSLFKRAVRGQFSEALQEIDLPAAPRADGAMPIREQDVLDWVRAAGLDVQHRAGIRIFHDHIQDRLGENELRGLLDLELKCRAKEPFASLAQHIHLVCRRLER